MEIPVKKLKNGFEMPVLGLGTWMMGGAMERDQSNDDAADIQAIRNAIEAGITHIDTAEKYAAGYSETLLGQAIKGHDRTRLFIASKVASDHAKYDDLIASCKASLERIGTDYFDLYMMHSPSLEVPIRESMRAMNTLVENGIIQHVGVSNFSVERLQEAQSHSNYPIVANQLHLNLIYREPERRGILEYCQKNDVMLVAWRPVQKGELTGKGKYPILDEMCEKYDKTPAQIAINWLISQPNVVTISKMRDPEHLEENLSAVGSTMEVDDIEQLRIGFPHQADVSDSIPLSKYD